MPSNCFHKIGFYIKKTLSVKLIWRQADVKCEGGWEAVNDERSPKSEEVKLSLFIEDIILNVENLRDFITKLLEVMNGFSKTARYKIQSQYSKIH